MTRGVAMRWDDDGCEGRRRQHRGGPPWAMWGEWDRGGHRHAGPGGPPPWVAELLGLGRPGGNRGAGRRRRGDVRMAILDVLRSADAPPNGYQVIQAITARSQGAWKPSPGSVYPTIQQLEDEGLVETEEANGRRAHHLSRAGRDYCEDHGEELGNVWAPFEDAANPWTGEERQSDIKAEIPQVMSAIWQIASGGSPAQRDAALDVLVDARRRLYGILADGREQVPEEE
ncbi:PadR family transcriptional regulator [Nocardioides panacisoli]|uniref:PadR family transcriptional regulator n=1 Tax=Nocardioides panacisoli TaxID=627624 RepID=UPI001C634EF7|nr:PadR family transcriptional regulator [Nocardioides panacisoli]QYJ03414.1 PadR family transcriptional regulator [Nocardioides panacisoli]